MRVEDAEKVAKAMNTSTLTVRKGLEQNAFPFGTAIKHKESYVYVLYPNKVKEYLNVEL